jgi:hypothetical protein
MMNHPCLIPGKDPLHLPLVPSRSASSKPAAGCGKAECRASLRQKSQASWRRGTRVTPSPTAWISGRPTPNRQLR